MKTSAFFTTVAALAFTAAAHAQVSVGEPWVRATVPAQQATGAFMRLQSAQDTRLVAAQSPVAGVVEIHEMHMDGSVMKMRPVQGGIALPAGQAVELKPGGYHIMFMALKEQIKPDDTVPMTLVFESQDGQRQSVEVQAPVRALGKPAAGHGHGGAKH